MRLQVAFLCLAAALVFLSTDSASAQTMEPCQQQVERAEEHYRNGEFEEAQQLLAPCLDQALMSDAMAVRGYRILAQSLLQTGDIAGARRAVLRVFARNPGYQSDPVQDPPAYQALVETVRQQLDDPAFAADLEQVRRERVLSVDEPLLLPEYRATGRIFLQVDLGATSYGGERGVAGSSAFSDFAENAGLAFAIGAGYNATDYLALLLRYEPARLPTILNEKGTAYPPVERDDSSIWLHTISGSVTARFLPTAIATPLLRGGVGASFIRINDTRRGAVALDIGVGVDFAASSDVGLHAEIGGRYTFPGDAIDLEDRAGDFDFLTLVRAGISWRVGSIR